MPVWPTTLPPPLRRGYQLRPVDPVLRSDVSAGPPQYRRRSVWAGPTVTATYRLTQVEAEQLLDWWSGDCQHGALPFVWYEPLRGRPGSWLFLEPPTVTPVSPGVVDVAVSIVALQEWWPGDLRGTGRSIWIWDARAADTVLAQPTGARQAAVGDVVWRWIDRVQGAVATAPEAARTPQLIAVNGCRAVRFTDDRLDLPGAQLNRAACGLALAVTIDADTPNYGRTFAALPATGNDYDRADAVAVASYDSQDIILSSPGVALNWTGTPITRRALVWRLDNSGPRRTLHGDGVLRDSETSGSVSGLTAGGFRMGAGHIGGVPSNYAPCTIYGAAVISGYAPTDAEVDMLGRWAAALMGKEL